MVHTGCWSLTFIKTKSEFQIWAVYPLEEWGTLIFMHVCLVFSKPGQKNITLQGPEWDLKGDISELEAKGYACVAQNAIDTTTIAREVSRDLAHEVHEKTVALLRESGF